MVTGLSGAGKSHVSRAFEDMQWSVIDNMPLTLVEPLVGERVGEIARGQAPVRTVVVLDARLQRFGTEFPAMFRRLKERRDVRASLIFVEADEDVLRRRYSETRRPHPLGGDPSEAIARERRELADVRALADSIIDTTGLTVHELRAQVIRQFADEGSLPAMQVSVVSFGFKHGIPPAADLVFDARFLPNPHFVPELRPKTGETPEIVAWLEGHDETGEFFERLESFVKYLLPKFAGEHKSWVTVAIGCTGGRHRSVYLARRLGRALEDTGFAVRVFHRDAGLD